jgi:hypothetical protein
MGAGASPGAAKAVHTTTPQGLQEFVRGIPAEERMILAKALNSCDGGPKLERRRTSIVAVKSSKVRAELGTELPSEELDFGFPPQKVNIAERCKGKRIIIVGLPGAFTPT